MREKAYRKEPQYIDRRREFKMAVREYFKNVWNAFMGRDPTITTPMYSYGSSYPENRRRYVGVNANTIVSSIFNQIAVDCSDIDIKHVRLNSAGKYQETIDDSLNKVLNFSANIDQTGRGMIQDAVYSMLEERCMAMVPVVTDTDPNDTESYTIEQVRIGKIVEWFPRHIRVELYDDRDGKRKQIILAKDIVAIVENPFAAIMNEPNSLLQRYKRVLSQLEKTNDANSTSKLDLIIQVPYMTKTPAKREYANTRRKEIEAQLVGSQLGIAYTDSSEKIIQLNRSLDNNLWEQEKELREQLYNQLGLCKAIFDGTADEKTLLNYHNRTIEPILVRLTEEMTRKWLSKTAISQKQSIMFFREPFKLVPVGQIAEIADKFTRNCIMTSNEIRSVMGMQPSDDPKADMLVNSNLNQSEEELKDIRNSKSKSSSKEEVA